ncbi:MAG: hypothetical protein NVSMB38_21530 [Ktedonobacteraceae bacterium]
MLVFQQQRQRGIGRKLMNALEPLAHQLGRTLLVLDTRQGDSAEHLYRKVDYREVGTIPSYAQNAIGTFDATIIFYKSLSPVEQE